MNIEPPISKSFEPGTFHQFAIDSTSLSWFRRCPRLYQYSMIQGFAPKRAATALAFGIAFHKAIEIFEQHRANREDFIMSERQAVQFALAAEIPEGDVKRSRFVLVRSVVWYLEHYRFDPCKTLILDNGKPAIELSFKVNLPFE